MNKKKTSAIVVAALIVITFFFKIGNKNKEAKPNKVKDKIARDAVDGLNRNPLHINYTKHAKCRMQCRNIDEAEIIEVLQNGVINYKKSNLNAANCNKKYALEAVSSDKQHIRIIVAPCEIDLTIVTCIDLEHEWQCDCK